MELLKDVSTALEKIKPTEQRIVGWQTVLPPIFNWEQKKLQDLIAIGAEVESLIIATPTKEDIPKLKAIDDKIKQLTKLASLSNTERLEITGPIRGLIERLMIAEKKFKELSAALNPTYVAIKKIESAEIQKEQARKDAISKYRLSLQNYFLQRESDFKRYINGRVAEVYKLALDTISELELDDFIQGEIDVHTPANFIPHPPEVPADAEFADLRLVECSKWNAQALSDLFASELRQAFVGFTQAKEQIEEAKNAMAALAATKEAEITETQEMIEVLNVIEEKATEPTLVIQATKELKTVWKIEMEHNVVNMRKINIAFHGNMAECISVWQGTDCWNISTNDQANLLCKLKNKDINFEVQGVVFTKHETR